MQAQIQKFVDDRTTMLAAISHDLRTPLTKMRLRGEFIEDEEQRARLFRDVGDMRATVDSALVLFRDDIQNEETTSFDFPELLRTIADDFSDHGCEVGYCGAERLAFLGRPFALKRAFTNLVDNAVKYARAPELELARADERITVTVRDSGPGIPPEAAERVFEPFFRLEPSRNRATGGVGLGLTSARAVIRAHGGDITLGNRPTGGLEIQVSLPEPSKRAASKQGGLGAMAASPRWCARRLSSNGQATTRMHKGKFRIETREWSARLEGARRLWETAERQGGSAAPVPRPPPFAPGSPWENDDVESCDSLPPDLIRGASSATNRSTPRCSTRSPRLAC